MSRLDDIKDQVLGQLTQTWERFQESSTYSNIKDRYDNLSPNGQKLALYGSAFFVLFLLIMPPLSHYRTSNENIYAYEEKQRTLRDLLRVSRETSEGPDLFPPPTIENLKTQVEGYFKSIGLIPVQIRSVQAGVAQGGLIPRDLTAGVLEINLAKLNIKQITDVGHKLSTLASTAKLKDMSITANAEDSRYFDASYSIYTLKVPERQIEALPEIDDRPKRGAKTPKDKANE